MPVLSLRACGLCWRAVTIFFVAKRLASVRPVCQSAPSVARRDVVRPGLVDAFSNVHLPGRALESVCHAVKTHQV